jgi:hypothetical protein
MSASAPRLSSAGRTLRAASTDGALPQDFQSDGRSVGESLTVITLIAADKTGRVCRGVKLDPLYVDDRAAL